MKEFTHSLILRMVASEFFHVGSKWAHARSIHEIQNPAKDTTILLVGSSGFTLSMKGLSKKYPSNFLKGSYTHNSKKHMVKKITAIGSVLSLAAFAVPAFALADVTVTNTNSADVTNDVTVSANTGINVSTGGAGGNGGDASAFAGDAWGGRGDAGGMGGGVTTGDATAVSKLVNDVNSNTATIKTSCECEGDITVTNTNEADVSNTVHVAPNTGGNASLGGDAGNGGTATTGSSESDTTGDAWGGAAGAGGAGADVVTGDATAGSDIVNLVNSTITTVTAL